MHLNSDNVIEVSFSKTDIQNKVLKRAVERAVRKVAKSLRYLPNEKECPHCGLTKLMFANFGIRVMVKKPNGDFNHKDIKVQSWCSACKALANKAQSLVKRSRKAATKKAA